MPTKKKCSGCGRSIEKRPICPVCKHEVPQGDHPGWITLRFFGLIGLLTVMLYRQASNFDETELKVIFAMAILVGPAMFAGKALEVIRKAVH